MPDSVSRVPIRSNTPKYNQSCSPILPFPWQLWFCKSSYVLITLEFRLSLNFLRLGFVNNSCPFSDAALTTGDRTRYLTSYLTYYKTHFLFSFILSPVATNPSALISHGNCLIIFYGPRLDKLKIPVLVCDIL